MPPAGSRWWVLPIPACKRLGFHICLKASTATITIIATGSQGEIMERRSHDNDVLPTQVELFQLLWFGGMIISAAYDCAVAEVGDHLEAWIDILLFAIAATLMHYAVRQRSNFARLLLMPFLVLTSIEVFSHDRFAVSGVLVTCLGIVQLGLMLGAVWLLFTPAARSWYSRNTN